MLRSATLLLATLALAACPKVRRDGKPTGEGARADGGVHIAERTPDASKRPAISLLGYLPDSAAFAVVADLAQARGKPFYAAVVPTMALPRRADDLGALVAGCGFDRLRDVDRILVGGSDSTGVLVVMQGHFDEDALMACVGRNAAARSRPFHTDNQRGHRVYGVDGVSLSLTFLARDTAVMARPDQLAWLMGPLGKGPPALLALAGQLDTHKMAWSLVSKLPSPSMGAIDMWGSYEVDTDLDLKAFVRFAAPSDATGFVKSLEQVRTGLQSMFGTVTVEAQGPIVTVMLKTSPTQLGQILSMFVRQP